MKETKISSTKEKQIKKSTISCSNRRRYSFFFLSKSILITLHFILCNLVISKEEKIEHLNYLQGKDLDPFASPTSPEPDNPFNRAHWAFPEHHNIIHMQASQFKHALETFDHLFVYFYVQGCRLSHQFRPRLLEIAYKNKMSLHPIPIAAIEIDQEAINFQEEYKVTNTPDISYFHNGKMTKYNGELEIDQVWDFMMLARWPGLETIHNVDRGVKTFIKANMVSVILWKGGNGRNAKLAERSCRRIRKEVPKVAFGVVHGYEEGIEWLKGISDKERISKEFMIREEWEHQNEDYSEKDISNSLPCVEIWTKFNNGRKIWCGWQGEELNYFDLEMLIKDFDFVNHARFNRTHSFSMWQHRKPRFILFENGDNSEEEMHFEHTLLKASQQFNSFEIIIASMKDPNAYRLRERLHIQDHLLPAFFCVEKHNDHMHKHKFEGNITVENLIKFEQDFLNKKTLRHYISQPKETLDAFQHNLKAVNSEMLQNMVKTSEKYLVIYMYKEHSPNHEMTLSQMELVSTKEELYKGIVDFVAIDIINNEFPEIYEHSYKRFPSHELHERILIIHCNHSKQTAQELEPKHFDSSREIYQFIKNNIPALDRREHELKKRNALENYLSDL